MILVYWNLFFTLMMHDEIKRIFQFRFQKTPCDLDVVCVVKKPKYFHIQGPSRITEFWKKKKGSFTILC